MKIIYIGATWCPSCLIMKPIWQQVEKDLPEIKLKALDIDEHEESLKKYKISDDTLPIAIILDKKNRELKRIQGELNKKKIIEILKTLIPIKDY